MGAQSNPGAERASAIRTCAAVLGAVAVLAGCAGQADDQLVEVTTTRAPAVVVPLEAPARCPSRTVLLSDDEPMSGAGAIPAAFDGRAILRCQVDYTTMTSGDGVDRFTVRQWTGPLTPELQTALALPDREYRREGVACGASAGSTTALYVVDAAQHAVRVVAPTDGPCHDIRVDVVNLLPGGTTPAQATFEVTRRSG